jgi:uncharacterized protein
VIKKIWFDITNTPQVHFLLALKTSLTQSGFSDFVVTAREFAETISLLEQKGINHFRVLGKHYGSNKIMKSIGLLSRSILLYKEHFDHDISISCGSESAIFTSKLHGKKAIAFGDNDLARQWLYGYFVDYGFFPDAIEKNLLERQGFKNKLYQYHGYKEDIYIADFKPDPSFISKLPFDHYVVVRPENIQANYLRKNNIESITPALLSNLEKRGLNVLYLPRYSSDNEYAIGLKKIFIPEKPLDGLNACYYSDAVLTGAGTFAREAACMGVPSFSFFAGKQLLAVDRKLIKEKKIFHSRKVDELTELLSKSKRVAVDFSRAMDVREELLEKILEKLKSF